MDKHQELLHLAKVNSQKNQFSNIKPTFQNYSFKIMRRSHKTASYIGQFIIMILTFFLSVSAHCQNKLTMKNMFGTWEAKIPESRQKSLDVLFDGATITINSDFTFTAKIIEDLSGKWEMKEGKIILDAIQETPSPIILSEISEDSCIWVMDKFRTKIPFFKINKSIGQIIRPENVDFVIAEPEVLVGDWINTHIEDVGKTKRQNKVLFGESCMNDRLNLTESGHFSMFRSAVKLRGDKFSKGTWSVSDGIVVFESETGGVERLGILKFSQDTLILVDLVERQVPFVGNAKIRFIYTKETAGGLKKYVIKPTVLDTFHASKLNIAFMVPDDFGEIYSIENMTISIFSFEHCSRFSNKEEKVKAVRKELSKSEWFVRFIDTNDENYIKHEGKTLIDDVWYELSYVFSQEGEVYQIKVGSFLEENVDVLRKSIEDLSIVVN